MSCLGWMLRVSLWLQWQRFPCLVILKILVESKSLKLYLNSLNQERYGSASKVAALLERDIAECVNGTVLVDIHTPDSYRNLGLATFPGVCLDDMDIDLVC